MSSEANVVEIFSSIQGEGILVGERQIFVRFGGCRLRCNYCDTPQALFPQKECRIEKLPGARKFYFLPNPLTPVKLREIAFSLDRVPSIHRHLSITGGEPLEQVSFLKEWLPAVKDRFKIYLETNGILSGSLSKIIDLVDTIAMDIKLPSSLKGRSFWGKHRAFLQVARKKKVFTKMVITAQTAEREVLRAAELIGEIDKRIPLILQPVSPSGRVKRTPPPKILLKLQQVAARFLPEVRVIPQIHKTLKIT
ncbi:MAG: 7-carboxy-7-deazaguanine synthase QueE [Deltaproteobacteria bacterium]|nr:MAG: 7-carboxy-7-deazaguanine synthase QueE [Deltaproteobacteria bacterium]